MRTSLFLRSLPVALALVPLLVGVGRAQERRVSFHREVRPILMRRCGGCHQPAIRGGRLSVATFAALKSGGVSGPGFVTGKPADSPLYKQISGKKPAMPKDSAPLGTDEVETIRLWITQGGRDDTPAPVDPISAATPPTYRQAPLIPSLAFSPDGSLLAVAGYREVLLHKADGSGLVARLVGRSQRIESVAFSGDGKYLAAVGGNSCLFGEVQLWDLEARRLVRSVEVGFDVLYGASFSPDGKYLACGSAERSAYLFSVPDGKQVLKFDNHSDWVFGTTFSKDSKHLVTTSRDRAVKLVEIATGNFVDDVNYQVYAGGYNTLNRHPAKDEVAVGGEEGLVRSYSIFKRSARTINRDDFNLLRTFENLGGQVHAIAFSPDGELMAVAGRSPEIRVYKSGDGQRVATLKGHSGAIHSLAWHPKGGSLAAGGFDGQVRLYAMPKGDLTSSFVPVPLSGKIASR